MTTIDVLKYDLYGNLTRRYTGTEVTRGDHYLVLEAPFVIDKSEMQVLDVVLKLGDRFVETYYSDRGYNIYEIFDRENGVRKGWYCNLSRPAQISSASVRWIDLALDLWAWPDGRTALLDEDEFAALPLDDAERARVRSNVQELQRLFREGRPASHGEGR